MLSLKEKRFIRYWQEQREGGRGSYYLLYIIVGTFIITLILSVFLVLFFQITFGNLFFWIVLAGGILLSSILTIYTWAKNERKLQHLIKREIEEGRSLDENPVNLNSE